MIEILRVDTLDFVGGKWYMLLPIEGKTPNYVNILCIIILFTFHVIFFLFMHMALSSFDHCLRK